VRAIATAAYLESYADEEETPLPAPRQEDAAMVPLS